MEASRGPKNLKLSNSITWSDQNCPTKGAYFAMFCLLTGKVRIILRHFHKLFFYLALTQTSMMKVDHMTVVHITV